MVSAYSLPGTVLPQKKLEIGEYAVACLVPGTVLFKSFKCDIRDVILAQIAACTWDNILKLKHQFNSKGKKKHF